MEEFEYGTRLIKEEGVKNRPPNAPAVFFLLSAPSFFFLFGGCFFCGALFPPSFFFFLRHFFRIFCLKTTIFSKFLPIFDVALFSPSFFFFLKAPSFLKKFFEGDFFSPSFRPPFFFHSRPPF